MSAEGPEDKQRQGRGQYPEMNRKTSKAACFEGVYEGRWEDRMIVRGSKEVQGTSEKGTATSH